MSMFCKGATLSALAVSGLLFAATGITAVSAAPVVAKSAIEPAPIVEQARMSKRKMMRRSSMRGMRSGVNPAGSRTKTDGIKRSGADK